MNTTQIIGAIMLATGKSVQVVAKENGCSKTTFYMTINNEIKNLRVQNIISKLIDRPISEIWPSNEQFFRKKNASTPADRSNPVEKGPVGRTSDPSRG